MLDESAFLKAIAEDEDEAARLAFADWLEERGDPRAPWVRDPAVFPWMLPDASDPTPALLAALGDDDWNVRHQAAVLLARIATPPELLLGELERDPERGFHAGLALSMMTPEAVAPIVPRLVEIIRTRDDLTHPAALALSAAGAAGACVLPDLIGRIGRNLEHGPDRDAVSALGALGRADVETAAAALMRYLWDGSGAAEALAGLGPDAVPVILREARNLREYNELDRAIYPLREHAEAARPALVAALADDDARVRFAAAMALASVAPAQALPVVVELLDGHVGHWGRHDLLQAYAEHLQLIGPDSETGRRLLLVVGADALPGGIADGPLSDEDWPALAEALRSADAERRRNAAGAAGLVRSPGPPTVAAVLRLLGDADDRVRAAAVEAVSGWKFDAGQAAALRAELPADLLRAAGEALRRAKGEARLRQLFRDLRDDRGKDERPVINPDDL